MRTSTHTISDEKNENLYYVKMSLVPRSKKNSKKTINGCTKWIRITDDEEAYYPDDNGRISNYQSCATCKTGTSMLHAVHVGKGAGDAICCRCGKDIDLVWLCRDRKFHKFSK
jgi:hypothetical protein